MGESIGRLVDRGATPDLDDPVKRPMQPPLTAISGHAFLDKAAQLFRQHEIELLPVHGDQERFVELISRQDVFKVTLNDETIR
ncbi:CBS domain-containing protein [Mesorhizobium sp. M0129]|uniref:CBS domain-containing protein n=1 Tax=Mesorhizobium sp. M0129 TaxID=2956886 RepID=UPI003339A3C4